MSCVFAIFFEVSTCHNPVFANPSWEEDKDSVRAEDESVSLSILEDKAYTQLWNSYTECNPEVVALHRRLHLSKQLDPDLKLWLSDIGRGKLLPAVVTDSSDSSSPGPSELTEAITMPASQVRLSEFIDRADRLYKARQIIWGQLETYLYSPDILKREIARDELMQKTRVAAVLRVDELISDHKKKYEGTQQSHKPVELSAAQASELTVAPSNQPRVGLLWQACQDKSPDLNFVLTKMGVSRSKLAAPPPLLKKTKLSHSELISLYQIVRNLSDRLVAVVSVYGAHPDDDIGRGARAKLVDMCGSDALDKFDASAQESH